MSKTTPRRADGHRRPNSVKKYAKVELFARKATLEKKIIRLPQTGTDRELKRKAKTNNIKKGLAEVHGNRTHRGHRLPATGFEVQEAHQNLSTSNS